MSLPDFDRSANPCPICGINNNSPFPCEHYYRGKPDVIKAALSVGRQEESVLYKEIWNEAIEKALQVCKVYDRGQLTDVGMIRLRIGELKK